MVQPPAKTKALQFAWNTLFATPWVRNPGLFVLINEPQPAKRLTLPAAGVAPPETVERLLPQLNQRDQVWRSFVMNCCRYGESRQGAER